MFQKNHGQIIRQSRIEIKNRFSVPKIDLEDWKHAFDAGSGLVELSRSGVGELGERWICKGVVWGEGKEKVELIGDPVWTPKVLSITMAIQCLDRVSSCW